MQANSMAASNMRRVRLLEFDAAMLAACKTLAKKRASPKFE